MKLTQELLKEYMTYNPETGELIYIKRPSPNSCVRIGDRVGSKIKSGAYQTCLFGVRSYAASLIWLYVYGYLPKGFIYHIDGDAGNDRLANLEEQYKVNINKLNQEVLLDIFDYNPFTGELIRKVCLDGDAKKGETAGAIHQKSGYRRVFMQGKSMMEHRLIWELVTGDKAESLEIDHIDGNRANNSWDNLRLATKSENHYNSKIRKDNTSGVKGVSFYKGAYKAQINKDTIKYIKFFKTKEEAAKYIESMRPELHGEFANDGFKNIGKN